MKNKLSLSVQKPCSEKWENFTPDPIGGFCNSCNKSVKDFTQMSDEELIHFFNHNSSSQCGKFRPDQLKTYVLQHKSPTTQRGNLISAGILSMLMVLLSKEVYATGPAGKSNFELVQTEENTNSEISAKADHKIMGIVKGEDGTELPGVAIMLKGTEVGTVTDGNGKFEFPQEVKEGDVLIFSFIGYVSEEYKVRKNSAAIIEIVMNLDLDITGEVTVDGPYTEKTSFVNSLWHRFKSIF